MNKQKLPTVTKRCTYKYNINGVTTGCLGKMCGLQLVGEWLLAAMKLIAKFPIHVCPETSQNHLTTSGQ